MGTFYQGDWGEREIDRQKEREREIGRGKDRERESLIESLYYSETYPRL